jgi:hypothetical protein
MIGMYPLDGLVVLATRPGGDGDADEFEGAALVGGRFGECGYFGVGAVVVDVDFMSQALTTA